MARMVSRRGSLGLGYKSLDGVLFGTGRIELRAVLGSGMILKGECKHLCCDRAPEPPSTASVHGKHLSPLTCEPLNYLLNLSTETKTISYNDSTLAANRPTPQESPRATRKYRNE
jgi:hypothetical protein